VFVTFVLYKKISRLRGVTALICIVLLGVCRQYSDVSEILAITIFRMK